MYLVKISRNQRLRLAPTLAHCKLDSVGPCEFARGSHSDTAPAEGTSVVREGFARISEIIIWTATFI